MAALWASCRSTYRCRAARAGRRFDETLDLVLLKQARPPPSPDLASLTLPCPPAEPHGGGLLAPASAAANATVAAALAALTRRRLRVRTGAVLCEAMTRGGPASRPSAAPTTPFRYAPAAHTPALIPFLSHTTHTILTIHLHFTTPPPPPLVFPPLVLQPGGTPRAVAPKL